MFTCKISVKKNPKDIVDQIQNSIPSGIKAVMEYAKALALKNKRGSKDDGCILFEINVDKDGVTGRLYTNFDYALFLEYGTGTKAELPHIGHTETFKKSGFSFWFLPKEIADSKGKQFSPERLINIKGELFYLMFSTQPYPFMRPTAFDLEDNAVKIFLEE